ncbi:MAG: hypothetical protein PWP52_1845 [Bacteroidales bacterium]|jgi:hypothetical protein|nr:hypothetical protein [Bacteroidales bacterium]
MQFKTKTQKKFYHTDLNMGVVIIFIIVTLIFLLSLTKSNYSKNLFSQPTEIVEIVK